MAPAIKRGPVWRERARLASRVDVWLRAMYGKKVHDGDAAAFTVALDTIIADGKGRHRK